MILPNYYYYYFAMLALYPSKGRERYEIGKIPYLIEGPKKQLDLIICPPSVICLCGIRTPLDTTPLSCTWFLW